MDRVYELYFEGRFPVRSFTFRVASLANPALQDFTRALRLVREVDLGVDNPSHWPAFPVFRLQFFQASLPGGELRTRSLRLPLCYFPSGESLARRVMLSEVSRVEQLVFMHFDLKSTLRVRPTLREFALAFKGARSSGAGLRVASVGFVDAAWGKSWEKGVDEFIELYGSTSERVSRFIQRPAEQQAQQQQN